MNSDPVTAVVLRSTTVNDGDKNTFALPPVDVRTLVSDSPFYTALRTYITFKIFIL